jgi:uncharacterized protein
MKKSRMEILCILVIVCLLGYVVGCNKTQPATDANAAPRDKSSEISADVTSSDKENTQVAQTAAEVQDNGKKKPNVIANFEAGIAAYQSNDLPLAYKKFLEAAKEGHADSQFNVALMYEKGIGVSKDEKEAVVWYGKAASQGNAAAQFNLGVLYENGSGTKVDFAKANEWYRKASVQGDALAIGNLGMLYVRGQGVKENKTAGVALLLVSATRDPSPNNRAKKNIAVTRGLTAEMIAAAQSLSGEMSSAKNLLVPLDQYLKETEKK